MSAASEALPDWAKSPIDALKAVAPHPACLAVLLERLNDEYSNVLLYRELRKQFKIIGRNGFAAFFEQQAAEEMDHAKELEDFLITYEVKFQPVLAEAPEFLAELEKINVAEAIGVFCGAEARLQKGYQALQAVAGENNDGNTAVLADTFVERQREEAETARNLYLRTVQAIESGEIEFLDRQILEELGQNG